MEVHSSIEPAMTFSIMLFIKAIHFLFALTHFWFSRTYVISTGALSFFFLSQATSSSFASLIGSIGLTGYGVSTTQSTSCPISSST
jgi:hypothetical protein